ncbi:hypothetical protein M407DRAFT_30967 [Tulasnella calospora MUT 4182]|uniref:Uncharacterized protein n=1 Tax=Tulasnella calospora MUT 4182 TaxID=1051891 RepID=A0A0C3KDA2_9AGAM|nr:hypothetical protein M407DRAFT_30967 [Tulasnella calospora MUT 4182]
MFTQAAAGKVQIPLDLPGAAPDSAASQNLSFFNQPAAGQHITTSASVPEGRPPFLHHLPSPPLFIMDALTLLSPVFQKLLQNDSQRMYQNGRYRPQPQRSGLVDRWVEPVWANKDKDRSPRWSQVGFLGLGARKKFPGGTFGAKTTGRTMYYITHSALINQVYEQPKNFAMSFVQKERGKNCFSYSDKALFETPALRTEIFPHMRQCMAPVNMMNLVESFERCLSKAIKTFPIPEPGSSVSLQDLILRLAHRATGAAWYGPTFDVESFWDDWQEFDDGVYKVALRPSTQTLRDDW